MEATGIPVVLIAPLDWGIGHASRCIPIIHYYVNTGHQVILASNGRSAALLRKEFPALTLLTDIPDYNVHYPENGNFTRHFIQHSARLLQTIIKENRWLRRTVKQYKIDIVISDNRYGLHHNNITCYFITHQLSIPAPVLFKSLLNKINGHFLRKFNQIFVPDFAGHDNLSGSLSHLNRISDQIRYIGPISRFSPFDGFSNQNVMMTPSVKLPNSNHGFLYDFMVIISGPEPTRTNFSEKIKDIFISSDYKVLILEGKTDSAAEQRLGKIKIMSHLNESGFRKLVSESRYIICRSGYSTLMDLYFLNQKAILIATPGQKEQEYLAGYHANAGNHVAIDQRYLSLTAIEEVVSNIEAT